MERIITLFDGLLVNIGITVCSAVIPLAIGVLASLLVKKAKVFGSICSWLNIGCEAVAIPVLVCAIYYIPGLLLGSPIFLNIDKFFLKNLNIQDVGRILPVILALPIAFFWYMPAKYNTAYSYAKNILYNGLGLISNLFKWSFVASVLMCQDLLYFAKNFIATKAMILPLLIALLITGAFLGGIALLRVIIKQFMK